MKQPALLCGCELEYFDLQPRHDEIDPPFNASFWKSFLSYLSEELRCCPGVRSGSYAEQGRAWNDCPTVLFLECGGKIYLDCASPTGNFALSYPEWATPECAGPLELSAYCFAADSVIAEAFQHASDCVAEPQGEHVALYRLSCPHASRKTKGFHESYSISEPLHRRLTDANDPLCVNVWIPFLATRQLLCAPGFLSPLGEVFVSERCRRISRLVGSVLPGMSEAMSRPALDGRIDRFCGSHSRRLHVLCGDAPTTEAAAQLQFGTTHLLLQALEHALLTEQSNPLNIGLNSTLSMFSECAQYRVLSSQDQSRFLDIQKRLWDVAELTLRMLDLPADVELVCELWADAIQTLDAGLSGLPGQIPWMQTADIVERLASSGATLPQITFALNEKHLLAGNPRPSSKSSRPNIPQLTTPSSVPRAQIRGRLAVSSTQFSRVDWNLFLDGDAHQLWNVLILEDPESSDGISFEDWLLSMNSVSRIVDGIEILEKILDETFRRSHNELSSGHNSELQLRIAEFGVRALVTIAQAKVNEENESMVCSQSDSCERLRAIVSRLSGAAQITAQNLHELFDADQDYLSSAACALEAARICFASGHPIADVVLKTHRFNLAIAWCTVAIADIGRESESFHKSRQLLAEAYSLTGTLEYLLARWSLAVDAFEKAYDIQYADQNLNAAAKSASAAGAAAWKNASSRSDIHERRSVYLTCRKWYESAVSCRIKVTVSNHAERQLLNEDYIALGDVLRCLGEYDASTKCVELAAQQHTDAEV